MHGQQSEERQKQHMWSSPSQRSPPGKLADSSASTSTSYSTKGGRTLNIGDTALFQAGNAPPFIGILRKVTKLTTDKEEQVKLCVNWLYRPADIKLAKGVLLEAAPNEIFYSFHKDDISAATLLHPCKVAFLRKGVELPAGVSSFVCRRVYDTASKCLWWLTDRDYTDERQDEVDQLLERTKLEMQATVQSGGPSPRTLTGPTSSVQLKSSLDTVQNVPFSVPGKGKKRECADQNLDPSKRERTVKPEDCDASLLKWDRSMKPEEIATITDKDGLANVAGVERLVQLMQQDQNDGTRKVADLTARRTMLAGVIAATEKDDCLNRFVQLGGLKLLDEWLQDAHKGKVGDGGSPKEGDKVVEELLLALLRALDRLPVDLDALKTCVVGKSVNHLRSHKNLEIQKKARKLVDIWKKRVDAEMKLSGEGKSGSGHIISWSYKQSSADLVHSHLTKGTGGAPEVAVKSSGAFAGNVKASPNGSCSGDTSVKPVSMSAGKTGSVLSTSLPALKDSNTKVSAANLSPDLPGLQVKEEKSSSSSQSQSNGLSWGSGAGKGVNLVWKDDAKNSTFSANANAKIPSSGGSRLPNVHTKGFLGASLSGGMKEVGAGKPLVWSRNAATEKAGGSVAPPDRTVTDVARDTPNSQQRLVVRLPNPGRSPARMSGGTVSGGTVDVTPSTSRSSSPSVPERHPAAGSSDAVEGKSRPQVGVQVSASSETGTDSRVGSGGKSGAGVGDDRSKSQNTTGADSVLECEKTGNDASRLGRTTSSLEAERDRKETQTSHSSPGCNPTYSQRGPIDGADDGGKESQAAAGGVSVEGAPPSHSESSAMEVDDGGMSLLATVAAAAEESVAGNLDGNTVRGEVMKGELEVKARSSSEAGPLLGIVNSGNGQVGMDIKEGAEDRDRSAPGGVDSPADHDLSTAKGISGGGKNEKEQTEEGNVGRQSSMHDVGAKLGMEGLSVEEGREERGEGILISGEEGGQSGERSVNMSNAAKLMVEQPMDTKPVDEGSAKAVELSCLKEYKSTSTHAVESKAGGCDGHLGGKFGKSSSVTEEKKLLLTNSKGGKSALEHCNGLSVGGMDYRPNGGVGIMDSRLQDEKDAKKRGQEAGQRFGRRVDSDVQKTLDLVPGFPEEDVLEVARQAANEVEQMERYGKPVSSTSSDRDGGDARALSTAVNCSEARDGCVLEAAAAKEHKRKPLNGTEEKLRESGSDAWDRRHVASSGAAHPDGSQDTILERKEVAADIVKTIGSKVGEEADEVTNIEVSPERKSSMLRIEEMDSVLEGGLEEKRRLLRSPSTQLVGVPGPVSPFPVMNHVAKPAARSLQGGEPTTPERAAEVTGPSDGAVGGSDVSERLDFDLNEGLAADDSPQDDAATSPPASAALPVVPSYPIPSAATTSSVAAPIAVLAATKGPFIPPASPMWIKRELGWKGSAATSAFRPAEPRRTPDGQQSAAAESSIASDGNLALNANGAKRARPPLEFDLNVADDIVMEDVDVAATTLSSQGSVLGMSLHSLSVPSSSVSGLSLLKPESSSSAHPSSNGGGALPSTSQQAPSNSGYGAARPNLHLDLNRMDDSEESGMPLSAEIRAAEGVGSSARSNNSTSQPPRRMMDFDLNDGPSFEESNGNEPALHPFILRKQPGNLPMPVVVAGLRMGENMGLSPWLSAPNNSFSAVAMPGFSSARTPEPPYSAAAAQSFLNASAGNGSVAVASPFSGEIYRGGPALSSSPAVVYPPAERVTFGGYGPFPLFGGSGFLPSSVPFTATSAPYGDSSGSAPFAGASSQLVSPATVTSSSYIRPPYLMGMPEVPPVENNSGAWARASLDLNAGPESTDTDGGREDMIHGRLPPIHPGVVAFNEQMKALSQVAASSNPGVYPPYKRKEPEGGWDLYRGPGFKQTAWR